MKRIFSFVFALALALFLAPAAFADVDLSSMSFDELVALKDQINLAIWNSADWQEVTVPQGVWQVGADIPAGKWTIKPIPWGHSYIRIGNELKDAGTDVKGIASETVNDPDYTYYDATKDKTEWTVDLTDGQYIVVNYGDCIFTPYAGKPSLGFK